MNVGVYDRVVRLLGGLGLLAIDFIASGDLEVALVSRECLECSYIGFWVVSLLSSWRNQHLCHKPTLY